MVSPIGPCGRFDVCADRSVSSKSGISMATDVPQRGGRPGDREWIADTRAAGQLPPLGGMPSSTRARRTMREACTGFARWPDPMRCRTTFASQPGERALSLLV